MKILKQITYGIFTTAILHPTRISHLVSIAKNNAALRHFGMAVKKLDDVLDEDEPEGIIVKSLPSPEDMADFDSCTTNLKPNIFSCNVDVFSTKYHSSFSDKEQLCPLIKHICDTNMQAGLFALTTAHMLPHDRTIKYGNLMAATIFKRAAFQKAYAQTGQMAFRTKAAHENIQTSAVLALMMEEAVKNEPIDLDDVDALKNRPAYRLGQMSQLYSDLKDVYKDAKEEKDSLPSPNYFLSTSRVDYKKAHNASDMYAICGEFGEQMQIFSEKILAKASILPLCKSHFDNSRSRAVKNLRSIWQNHS